MTPLEHARRDFEQAKRHLRRVQQERRVCRYAYLDVELDKANRRVERTRARLAELDPQATRPGAAETPQQTQSIP